MEKENANNTNNSYVEIRLSDFWKAFRRCWWLLLAALILVTGVTYLFMDRTHVDQYQSTVTIEFDIMSNGKPTITDPS